MARSFKLDPCRSAPTESDVYNLGRKHGGVLVGPGRHGSDIGELAIIT
jgi:hypothetical protein